MFPSLFEPFRVWVRGLEPEYVTLVLCILLCAITMSVVLLDLVIHLVVWVLF